MIILQRNLCFIFFIIAFSFEAICLNINRVDPPNWWVGFQSDNLELLFYGDDFNGCSVETNYPGLSIISVTTAPNPSYIFVNLKINESCQPGTVEFRFVKGRKKKSFNFELHARNSYSPVALTSADAMYLLMPDRFSNGDPSNDEIDTMNEPKLNREYMFGRHGGDISGIVNHLDYLENLGVTALWINPLVENDQPEASYHGYAATDLYTIDPRFGSNTDYVSLCENLHARDMKIVMDVVYNHWGNEHELFRSPPDSNWFHYQDHFERTSYRAPTLLDPHASEKDRDILANGWFDHHMPDLNQKDPRLSTYLIQNSIWWIEHAGIDAFRIDTYAYPDQGFMARLGQRLELEYPGFFHFAETWVHGTFIQDWFLREQEDFGGYQLPSVTDFQLYYAINEALNEPIRWEGGLNRIYYTLAADGIYENPDALVTFLDNHDLSRFYSMVGEDMDKFKLGMTMLLTIRGIPCIYYGTEILMKNYADPDGKVRDDFPGGWEGDESDKFKIENLKMEGEAPAFFHVRDLLQWRKNNSWIADSKFTHFVPEGSTYTYFRTYGERCLMVSVNTGTEAQEISLDRFAEVIPGGPARDVLSGKAGALPKKLTIPAVGAVVLELGWDD